MHDCSYFDNYIEGELVMFRHKTLPYAVHTFQRRCNGHAACHCIIAIRSGDDVIVIDSCGPDEKPVTRTPQMEVRLYLNGDLTPGTKIEQYNGGTTYKVSVGFLQNMLSRCSLITLILLLHFNKLESLFVFFPSFIKSIV